MLESMGKTIYQIESKDTTTVKLKVPYLLSKYIRDNTSVKVILSGEGSDEASGHIYIFIMLQIAVVFKMNYNIKRCKNV